MRSFTTCLLTLLCLCASAQRAAAADDELIANYREAMASSDADAKRKAVRALSAIKDKEVLLPLLVQATGDRQVSDAALAALSSATGVSPRSRPDSRGMVGTGYPDYPTTATAAGWGAWLAAWRKEQDDKKKAEKLREDLEKAKAEADKKAKEDEEKRKAEEAAANGETPPVDPDAPTDEVPAEVPPLEVSDEARYGALDRIVLRDGGVLLCHILTKREDLRGNVTSVEVQHRDGGGREVLDAKLIARIEEDIK